MILRGLSSMRRFFPTLRGLVCGSILVLVAGLLTAEDHPATESHTDKADNIGRQRERRFAEARALADQDQWSKAIRAAQAALQLESRQDPRLETDLACSMQQHLAVWQQVEGNYPAAVGSYRQLLKTRTKVLGPSHWLTLSTQVDLNECQRDAQRSAADQRRLAEGNQFEIRAMRFQAAGEYELARESATKSLQIRQQVVEEEDGGISECLDSVGVAHLGLGKYKDAQPYIERSAAIRLRLFGLKNPSTLSTLHSLAVICMSLHDDKQSRGLLEKIVAGHRAVDGPDNRATFHASLELASFHMHRGNFAEAEPLMTAVLDKQVATLGDKNLDVAETRMLVGRLYARKGDPRARQYLQDTVALFRELGTADSPDVANALAVLAQLEYVHKNYDAAETHCKESLDIFAKTVGKSHPDAVDTLACLARICVAKGDAGAAERLFRQALEMYEQLYGEQHQSTASVLTELGALYRTLRDPDRAQACLERALKINRAVLGNGHSTTIMSILTLAGQHALAARLDEAENQMKEAHALAEKNLGSDHETTHSALFLLGNLYVAQRNYEKAEQTIRTVLESRQAKFPDQLVANATILESLVSVLIKKEDYEQAADLGNQVLEVYAQTLPKLHWQWTSPLQDVATACFALGRYEDAKALAQRAIEISQQLRDKASIAQSEHQQILMSVQQRSDSDLYLSLPASAVSADEAYAQVLVRKGAIHARQVRQSRKRGADQAPLVAEVQRISTQVATLSLQVPEPAARTAWLKRLRELRDRKSTLEAQLAHATHDLQATDDPTVTPESLRSALPDEAALIDLYLHSHICFEDKDGKPKLRRVPRLNAFIVRRGQPVQRVDLGERDLIEKAVDDWRAKGRYTADSSKEASAASLRQLVWEPVQPYLDGCRTVLFSPDGKLAGLPLGALPGNQPGSYLLEDYSIAVIAVPQLLPEMLGSVAPGSKAVATTPSLLLIGDVDYDAASGHAVDTDRDQNEEGETTGGELVTFARLKSTGPEAQSLAKIYRQHFPEGKVTLLQQGEATEAAVRREAPLHTCLLMATHGFYAPAGIMSALAAQNRPRDLAGNVGVNEYGETLSGLALAGANLGAAADADNGILTAAEVWSLDLRNLDLAVLSGCETALGAISDGEGALGLQRAFQVAGARTTVSSLWNVPDGKTSQLMQRFHMNLWHKKMSKLDALRDAQLWMMRTGGKELSPDNGASTARVAPYYWAAFVLSGDWR
jgi:CHAT domain-containing protein